MPSGHVSHILSHVCYLEQSLDTHSVYSKCYFKCSVIVSNDKMKVNEREN